MLQTSPWLYVQWMTRLLDSGLLSHGLHFQFTGFLTSQQFWRQSHAHFRVVFSIDCWIWLRGKWSRCKSSRLLHTMSLFPDGREWCLFSVASSARRCIVNECENVSPLFLLCFCVFLPFFIGVMQGSDMWKLSGENLVLVHFSSIQWAEGNSLLFWCPGRGQNGLWYPHLHHWSFRLPCCPCNLMFWAVQFLICQQGQ